MLALKITIGGIALVLIAYALAVSPFIASDPTKDVKFPKMALIVGLILVAIDLLLILFN